MTTLRKWFADFTTSTGETPTAIAINSWETLHNYRDDVVAVPVPFDTLLDVLLDREFDAGYGGNDSPNLCAWSDNWVLFSDDYDGAESLCWIPRNPTAHAPIRPGGG